MFPGMIRIGNEEQQPPDPAILMVPGSHFRALMEKQIASLRVFIVGIETGDILPDEDGDPRLETYKMTLEMLLKIVHFITDGPHEMGLDEYRAIDRKLSEYLSPSEYMRERERRQAKGQRPPQISPEEIQRLASAGS